MGEEDQSQSQDQNVNQDANPPASWLDGLSDDVKTADNLKVLERFKTVDDVAKSYVEAQKVISKKGIIVPGEKATPEEIDSFHKALGRPDTIDGYELKAPELPKGMTFSEEVTKKYAEAAHKLGVSKATMQELFKLDTELKIAEHNERIAQGKKFLDDAVSEMKKEWGKDFDANLKIADEKIETIFGKEFKDLLKQTGFNNHPAIIRGCFKAAKALSEHSFAKGGDAPSGETYTMEKLISMKMDKKYHDLSSRDPHYVNEVNAYAEKLAEQQTRLRG